MRFGNGIGGLGWIRDDGKLRDEERNQGEQMKEGTVRAMKNRKQRVRGGGMMGTVNHQVMYNRDMERGGVERNV